MKKTLSFVVGNIVFLSFFGLACAQVSAPPASQSIHIAANDAEIVLGTSSAPTNPVLPVSITNARVQQSKRDFLISFSIANTSDSALPEMNYAVQLVKTFSANSLQVVDEKVATDTIALDQSSVFDKSIEYTVPQSLSGGAYSFKLIVGNTSGSVFDETDIGSVNIPSNPANSIEIVPGSCSTFVSGAAFTSGLLFVSATDTLVEKCQVNSSFSKDEVLTAQFETQYANLFGNTAPPAGISAAPITIKPGINSISFTIPQETLPQQYYVSSRLMSADGSIISNPDLLGYFVRGLQGTIENAVFDDFLYKTGATANLKVFSIIFNNAARPFSATGTLGAVLDDGSGNACSASSTVTISSTNPLAAIPFIVTRDCYNPTAHFVLSATENGHAVVLDTEDFTVATPQNSMPQSALNLLYVIIAVIIIALILIIVRSLFAKKRLPAAGISLVIILFLVMAFGFAKTASANSCYPNPANYTNPGFVYCYGNTGNIHIYDVNGDNVSGSFYGTNAISGGNDSWLVWPQSSVAQGVYYMEDDGSNSSPPKELFQSGGQTFSTGASISAAANPVVYGTPTNISWGSTGASSCDIWENGSMIHQSAGTGGTISTGPLTATSTFTVYCGFYAPTGQSSVTIGVVPAPTISPSPSTVNSNSPTTTISWNSNNENFCSISEAPTGSASSTPFVTGSLPTAAVYQLGSSGTTNGLFQSPSGVAVDSSGNIYVADTQNHNIQKFDSYGNYISQFTYTGYSSGSGSGPGGKGSGSGGSNPSATGPFDPTSIAIDSANNLYVTDANNDSVEKFVPSGNTYVFSNLFGTSHGELVAVGNASDSYNDGVMTSTDGITWTKRTTPSFSEGNMNLNSVTYGNGVFVAVGNASDSYNDGVMTSTDGITWTKRTTPSFSEGNMNLNSVTYGNGVFVAVGNAIDSYNDGVMTSTDGITWTKRTTPSFSEGNMNLNSVTYGNGVFVAVGNAIDSYNDGVMTSTDGITWTKRTTPSFSEGNMNLNSVTYGNGVFVAVGNAIDSYNDGVMTSTDGITWTKRTTPSFSEGNMNLNSVTYGNGVFVAVGNAIDSYNDGVMTSTDGITWTKRTTPSFSEGNMNLNSVTYGNGVFVAVGNASDSYNDGVMTSTDGITWTKRTTPSFSEGNMNLNSVTYGQAILPFAFNNPSGIAVDASSDVYVADSGNNVIEKFDSSGNLLKTFPGYTIIKVNTSWTGTVSTTTTNYSFSNPTGVAVDASGDMYVADVGNSMIDKLDPSGNYISQISFTFSSSFWSSSPATGQLAIDSSGDVYVSGKYDYLVELNPALSSQLNQSSVTSYQYSDVGINPHDTLSGAEAIYGVDTYNDRVLKFSPALVQEYFKPALNAPETSGSSTASIGTNTTFLLSCTDGGGHVSTASTTVTYTGPQDLPAVTLSAQDALVGYNSPTNLTYTVANVRSYTIVSNQSPSTPLYSGGVQGNYSQTISSGNLTQDSIFTLSAIGSDVNSTATSTTVKVGVGPAVPANVIATTTPCGVNITWTEAGDTGAGNYSYAVYRDGVVIPATFDPNKNIGTITGNWIYPDSPGSGSHTYAVQAFKNGSQAGPSSPAVPINNFVQKQNCSSQSGLNTCQIVQTNGPDTTGNKVYVNKQVTFTVDLPGNFASPFQTVWSGDNTNWSGQKTISGPISSISNIYTTVGVKHIYATTTDSSVNVNTESCSATTTVILAPSTNQEI